MAEMLSYGVASVEMGDINAGTGLGENYADIGKVYKDTAKLITADANVTEHFSERDKDPVIVVVEDGAMELELSIMDMGADNIVKYLGGTVTDNAGGKNVWNKPRAHVNIEQAFKFTTDDGTIYEFLRCKVIGKLESEFTRKGTAVVKLMLKVLTPLVAAVPPLKITDNADTA